MRFFVAVYCLLILLLLVKIGRVSCIDSIIDYDDKILEKDLYKVLGLKNDDSATPKAIKKAYHKLAQIHHPDKTLVQEDKALHAALFREIAEAYEILSNPTSKGKYDHDRAIFVNKANTSSQHQYSNHHQQQQQQEQQYEELYREYLQQQRYEQEQYQQYMQQQDMIDALFSNGLSDDLDYILGRSAEARHQLLVTGPIIPSGQVRVLSMHFVSPDFVMLFLYIPICRFITC